MPKATAAFNASALYDEEKPEQDIAANHQQASDSQKPGFQNPKDRQKKIQELSLEIAEFMVKEIRASLPKIGMIHESEKEQAVHPLYKIIFQETVKRSLANDWDDDDSPFHKIGIEGFEPERI